MKVRKAVAVMLLIPLLILYGCPQSSATLTSVVPNVIPAGSPSTQIKLSGTGFVQGATVVWNEGSIVPLATTFVDSKDLVATVPANLLTKEGTASVFAAQGSGQNQTATQALTITIGNVLPTLTGCAPCHVIVGSPSPTLTLTGTNFNSSSVVNWTVGTTVTPLSTTLVSSTSLTAVVPTSLYTSAGSSKLSVANGGTGGGSSASLNFTIVAQLAIGTTSLPAGTLGVAYTATLSATGGTSPYTWSITSGSLPAGLTLGSTTGVISGTPTAAGSSSFTIQVVDSTGALARRVIR